MLSIATDENNDIYLDEFGNLATVTGIEAVAQVCRNTVLTTYGELTYDVDGGIPYFETVFTDPPNLELFQNAVVSALQNVESVTRVKSFNYSVSGGTLSYTAEIVTAYGEMTLNG